jgi:hypothetical protein
MILRIEEETNPNWIGAIAPLAQQIEDADLAIKLGFHSSPIVFSHRWQPDFERVDFLIWNDPFATGGGEMILRLLQVIKDGTGKEARAHRVR